MLVPVTQSVIVDLTTKEERGFSFGGVQLSVSLGVVISAVFATSISHTVIRGHEGWRVAFAVVGCMSLALAFVIAAFMTEPDMGGRSVSEEPMTLWGEMQ